METVASKCKEMTVITIAHRIATIVDLDRVFILDHGSLVIFTSLLPSNFTLRVPVEIALRSQRSKLERSYKQLIRNINYL